MRGQKGVKVKNNAKAFPDGTGKPDIRKSQLKGENNTENLSGMKMPFPVHCLSDGEFNARARNLWDESGWTDKGYGQGLICSYS